MGAKKSILVIDDDQDFVDYVSIILTANGYDVRSATTMSAGLALARAMVPDLVIADVMMSYGLEGWNIGREMRSDPSLERVKLVMVSAIVSERNGLGNAAYAKHADGFMSKPIEPAELLLRVAQLTSAESGGAHASGG